MSATACSTSRSVGTTYTTVPRGRACDAAATYNAFAGGVSPETTVAGRSMPLLATAVLSRARRLREVDVVKPIQIIRFAGRVRTCGGTPWESRTQRRAPRNRGTNAGVGEAPPADTPATLPPRAPTPSPPTNPSPAPPAPLTSPAGWMGGVDS